MIEVICPKCSTESRLEEVRRHADSFCPVAGCDYPLFWAVNAAAVAVADGDAPDHRRRLPGVAGRQLLATRACWSCAEENPADGVICVRCGLPLDPPAEPDPPPEIVVEAPPPPPEPESSWLAWVLVGVFFALILGVAVWSLNTL